MAHTTATKSISTVLALAALALLGGCVRSVQFSVLRPAKVNVKSFAGDGKASVSIGSWRAAEAVDERFAAEIGQYLRQQIVHAEGQAVSFAETGGAVTLDGTLQQHDYGEDVTSYPSTCQRGFGKKAIKYPCTIYTRSGRATVRVAMNVLDAQGTTVSSDNPEFTRSQSTSATDAHPPMIDWQGTLLGLRKEAAASLAQSVVPYRVVLKKRVYRCGDAKKVCEAGYVQLQQGNFEQAANVFKAAQEQLARGEDRKALAAAYWGLTLTYEFSGDFATARAQASQAISNDPGNPVYAAEIKAIDDEENAQVDLLQQGAKMAER